MAKRFCAATGLPCSRLLHAIFFSLLHASRRSITDTNPLRFKTYRHPDSPFAARQPPLGAFAYNPVQRLLPIESTTYAVFLVLPW